MCADPGKNPKNPRYIIHSTMTSQIQSKAHLNTGSSSSGPLHCVNTSCREDPMRKPPHHPRVKTLKPWLVASPPQANA